MYFVFVRWLFMRFLCFASSLLFPLSVSNVLGMYIVYLFHTVFPQAHEISSLSSLAMDGRAHAPCAGETDWKLIGIDVTDPLAPQLNGVSVQ